ncbi:hypothetical protein GOBAR_AA26286 [Gossypium barbadense]|uniref:Uncharacterized protein n=1 Tax=Gossypium barbadense TaxID=3634 RepID=A0A2P5WTG3_GOSBA|nr:hypothetical protein GOBAR_AA26286 [Gossypium barbadense]
MGVCSFRRFDHGQVARPWPLIASHVGKDTFTLFFHGHIARPCFRPCWPHGLKQGRVGLCGVGNLGIAVSMVMKYVDNIVKVYSTSVAMLLTAVVSVFLFGFNLTLAFFLGATSRIITHVI